MPFRYLGPPPPLRPNWNNLNSSQKRYAIKQHNIARARRNLPAYVLGEQVEVEPDIPVAEEEEVVGEHNSDNNSLHYETDSDLDWSFDGGINPNRNSTTSGSMTSVTSTTPKRNAEASGSNGGSASKKAKLPGTGDQAAVDPDTGNPSVENFLIPRPIHKSTGYTLVFRKNHSLISYGVASVQLQLGSYASERMGTTSLMYLPVDKPYFYMSPSEFNNIVSNIRGIKVLEVKCNVVMRNPRTAFETNASTSNLATLNQNKFIQHSIGLINNTRGINTVYKFSTATNTMLPTSVECVDETFLKKVISAMYGTSPTNWLKPNFTDGPTLPCSMMNLPMQFPCYYTMYTNSVQNGGEYGWQMINEKITKCDASSVIGTTIINYSYKPTVSYLNMPWKSVYQGRTQTKGTNVESFTISDTNESAIPNIFNINVTTGDYTNDISNYGLLTDAKWKTLFPNNWNRYIEPIECGQYIKHGLRPATSVKLQPSLHIGVCPVPQLTTTNANFVPDKFTDIECQWDIEVEMVCEYGLPYNYSHFKECHVNLEQTSMVVDKNTTASVYYEELSTFNNQFITPTNTII